MLKMEGQVEHSKEGQNGNSPQKKKRRTPETEKSKKSEGVRIQGKEHLKKTIDSN